MSTWYYSVNSQQYGPVSRVQLDQVLAGKNLTEVLVWTEGMPQWVSATEIQQVAAAPATPYASPQSHVQGLAARRTSGMAVASMILGIVSVLSFGMFLIPQVLAVVFGHVGIGQCKSNPDVDGHGMAVAGLVMGYIFIALSLLFFFVLLVPLLFI